MNIYPSKIHFSWDDFLTVEIKKEILEISDKIGHNINPEPENVFKFMEMDLNNLKVVILGQDPYPEKGRATGRCFEVGDLNDWNDKFRQVSLKNIIRLLYKNYNEIIEYDDIKKFSDIQKEIRTGEFEILSPNRIFKSWENQGVLLLNTYLTVESGKPGSHSEILEKFSDELIKYISYKNEKIRWFLWGAKAQEKESSIIKGKLYKSRHPMMCSKKYDDDFLKNECFNDTKKIIKWI